ncbi:hypothetical protein HJC23_012732 [Cyclotella cryptica]|uniref:Sulfotransferase domain-containing protein n=1 Tax=Cyclotella cryptica TaxID=29204 RepID=A0ABD3P7R7_9STRA
MIYILQWTAMGRAKTDPKKRGKQTTMVTASSGSDNEAEKLKKTHINPPTSSRYALSIRNLPAIVFVGVYGLICYQIGASSRSTDLQWAEMVEPSLQHAHTTLQRAPIVDSDLPYRCGVVFFYHIPSTGGSTINKWLINFSPKSGGNVKYFTHWGSHHNISGGERVQHAFIYGENGGMNEFVKELEPNEWRIAHCHHNSLHLNESEHYLDLWRSEVEAQGCHFLGNVMFRESLSHSLSLYKHLDRYESSKEEWTKHLYTKSEMGHWATQLDFFLYNNLARNPYAVSKQEKVRRALDLLEKHFDIVTVGDHSRYKDTLLRMTGWENKIMPRQNTYPGTLVFTKEEVEELQKLLNENGDIDFLYEVKKIYGNQNE